MPVYVVDGGWDGVGGERGDSFDNVDGGDGGIAGGRGGKEVGEAAVINNSDGEIGS